MKPCPSCGCPPHLIVYVAGPFTAIGEDTEFTHIMRARALGLAVRAYGFVPMVPHVAILQDDPKVFTYEHAISECLQIIVKCDRVLMMPGWDRSRGATIEHKVAHHAKIPVFYTLEELLLHEMPVGGHQQ